MNRQSASGSSSEAMRARNSSCIRRRESEESTCRCAAPRCPTLGWPATAPCPPARRRATPLHRFRKRHDGERVGLHRVRLAVRHGEPVAEAGRVGLLALPHRFFHLARPFRAPFDVEQVDGRLDRLRLVPAVRVARAPAPGVRSGTGWRRPALPGRPSRPAVVALPTARAEQLRACCRREASKRRLHGRDARRGQADLVESEAQEQRQGPRVAGQLAAEAHPAARPRGRLSTTWRSSRRKAGESGS